jgi:hypothetical protein
MLLVGGATFTIASVFLGEAAQHFAAAEVVAQSLTGHGDGSASAIDYSSTASIGQVPLNPCVLTPKR